MWIQTVWQKFKMLRKKTLQFLKFLNDSSLTEIKNLDEDKQSPHRFLTPLWYLTRALRERTCCWKIYLASFRQTAPSELSWAYDLNAQGMSFAMIQAWGQVPALFSPCYLVKMAWFPRAATFLFVNWELFWGLKEKIYLMYLAQFLEHYKLHYKCSSAEESFKGLVHASPR